MVCIVSLIYQTQLSVQYVQLVCPASLVHTTLGVVLSIPTTPRKPNRNELRISTEPNHDPQGKPSTREAGATKFESPSRLDEYSKPDV